MQAAQKYLAKGQLDRAIVEYENVVKSDPKDARMLLKLGDLYTRKGATKEASATYRKVAEQYAEQGFFLKAVAVCKQILKLDPGQLDVWEKLAEMYELLSLASDALATYEQLYEAHTRAGNTRKALRALEKLAELDPENVAARIRYAEALSKANKTEDAALAFAQGAELLKKQGRLDDFLKVGERLLFHQPDNHAFARELAAIYLDSGEAKLALTKLQPCFNADPRDVETLRLLARAFEQLGQVQKTLSVLKEVARLYGEQQKIAEQGSVLRKIVALDPDDSAAKRDLSQLGHLPVPDDAIEISEDDYDAIVVDEDEEPTTRKSGPGVASIGGSGAVRMPSQAPKPQEDPRRAQIARLLGECDVFMRYGLYDKMVAQLHQVLDLDPHNVEARAKLKDVFLKTNKTSDAVMQLIILAEVVGATDPSAAREHLREALKLDPHNSPVAEHLAALDTLVGDAAPEDEDEVIILDHDEDAEPAPDMSAEESFAGLNSIVVQPPADELADESYAEQHDAPADEDDEPEMTVEEGEEGDDGEIVMAAEQDEPGAYAGEEAAEEELPEELAEALEEIDFYLKQGLADEARDTLNDALESHPAHPALLAKRRQLDALGGQPSDDDEPELTAGDDDNDSAFAMAQKLANDASPASSSGAGGPIEVADVLAQFKKGVAQQVDRNDSATHYDLGIAYMEMGLHVEAIEEFKLCLNDPARICTSHTMIGLSYVAKGDMEPGIEHFKLALRSGPNAEEELGLWFEIGNAHELLGKNMEALVWYEKVEEKNPAFRDVAERIERLGVSHTPEQEADEFDEMFDNMIVKDD